ncbi:Aspartate aminotransferase P2, mitochondrial [Auxenochlorella protothecoides]|uniref:Aspartate aminotransferase n=1 Tax=Auxenochlorella protothecoides TaxID=3075 RepID=A0A087SKY5_AUXPR|nr:Aspartate aminotransferase P2, mitochondrial [Auxenochlorella protothecoides]KFM26389.1 Aspartate aminotransferase P2, mitochondrial [Auxenochlorella protothecoides]
MVRSTDRLIQSVHANPGALQSTILGVSEAFKRETSTDKLNLGVGAYRTEELQPYVLRVVGKAEKRMLERGDNKEYLSIEGLPEFRAATVELLLGADSAAVKEGRVATLQSLSGTGSLRVAAAFLAKFLPGVTVYLSRPTWGNHKNIFGDAGVEWREYAYFNPATVSLDFDGMLHDIAAAPAGSWSKIADVIEERHHLAFFDVAYQGFASGSLDDDAFAPRLFVERGLEVLVAQSYSKNLGLYAERIGALNIVLASSQAADRVLSQLKRIARAIYSNPPVHGARIVAEVVGDAAMFGEWNVEMEEMAGRIKTVRQDLYDHLTRLLPSKDWSFIGMFSFTGLSPQQVENMTNKWHVFMTKDGRISLAGLNRAKAGYLAEAIVDSVQNA